MSRATNNIHVKSAQTLKPPSELLQELPLTERAADTVAGAREAICRVIHGQYHSSGDISRHLAPDL
jgi:phospho-2-dehydro-3-deoxyheptonate aldolase